MDVLLETIGRSMGAAFHLTEVRGLPPTPKPVTGATLNKVLRQLPVGYLRDHAERFVNLIHKKYDLSEADLEEVISTWLVRFISTGGWELMPHGLTLYHAMRYVWTCFRNDALNFIQHRKYRASILSEEGGRDPSYEMEEIPVWSVPKVREILEQKVHPDAPLFLDRLFEGYEMKEAIQTLPTYTATYQNWQSHKMPLIREILKKQA